MLRAAIGFLMLAVLAFILGAEGVGVMSLEVGRVLIWTFLSLAAVTGVLYFFSKPPRIPSLRNDLRMPSE